MSCALGAWCRNRKVNRNQLTVYIFLLSCVIGWVLMSCALGLVSITTACSGDKITGFGGLVSNPQDVYQEKPDHNVHLCHWLGAPVMCSTGPVLKPQCEPGTKPAHNIHFLIPCHWLGAHVICCKGVLQKPQGEPGSKPIKMYSSLPGKG